MSKSFKVRKDSRSLKRAAYAVRQMRRADRKVRRIRKQKLVGR